MPDLEFPPLYPITHRPNRHGLGHADLARLVVQAGARIVQVREKSSPDGPLLHELLEARAACQASGARLIVNDRVDLALAARAHGVHLGQDDLPAKEARRLMPKALIGLSTHSLEQLELALLQPVDYVALGPIFSTSTKPGSPRGLGLEMLRRAAALSPLPLVAIGGITLQRAKEVWSAGARSLAVISDIMDAANPARRVAELLRLAEQRAS